MSVHEVSGAGLSVDAVAVRQASADTSAASTGAEKATRSGTSISNLSEGLPILVESPSLIQLSLQVDLAPRVQPTGPRHETADGPHRLLTGYTRWARMADVVVAGLAAVVAVTVRFGTTPGVYLLLPALLPLGWVTAVWLYRAYEHRFVGEGLEEFHRIVRAGLLLFTTVAVLSYLMNGSFSRTIAMMSVPFCVLGSMLARRILRSALRRARAAGRGLHRTLIVGRSDAAVSLIDSLRLTEPSFHHGMLAVGVCMPAEDVTLSHVNDVPVIGTPDDVLTAIDLVRADTVAVVSHPDLSGHALRQLSWALEERGVELLVSPGIVEVAGPRLSIRPFAGLSLLHLERPVFRGTRRVIKVMFDYALATALVIALSPIMLVLAAVIRATSQGPALFRQTRVGTQGREFTVYKFRSMVTDAEARLSDLVHQDEGNGVLFKMRSDPRVTRVGNLLRRYSLDEIPQLLNVLRGNMSLVGPRPPLPSEVAGYSADEIRRLRVRPGMTGLWQVSGRSDLTWEESLRLDLRYVDNWSMSLDLSILWRTFRAVIKGSGAY
jgi:exopolysaccharide biosynthesis polyprenyl glycosylphosphotransferase